MANGSESFKLDFQDDCCISDKTKILKKIKHDLKMIAKLTINV